MSIVCLAASSAPAMAAASKSAAKTELKLQADFSDNNPGSPANGGEDLEGDDAEYATVITQNPNDTYSPGLASTWGYVGKDNKTFEFTLRQGEEFANGAPITAKSVAAWLNYFYKTSSSAQELGKVSSIQAVSKLTVRIEETQPDPVLPFELSEQSNAGYIASAACAANPNLFNTSPKTCASGEYVLDLAQTVSGDHWTFTPNPHYYDPSAIAFSKVYMKYVADPTSAEQGLASGEFNVSEGTGSSAAAAKSAGFKVYAGGTSQALYLSLDTGGAISKPLASLQVRQAINYAINRKAVSAVFGGGYATATDELPTIDGFVRKYNAYYPYDPAKAKQLLAQAGYSSGFTLDDAVAPGFAPNWQEAAEVVAQDLASVGITVNFTYETPLTTYIQTIFSTSTAPLIVVTAATEPMWEDYNTDIPAANHFGGSGWHDPALGRLFSIASIAKSPAAYWQEMTARLVTNADVVPLTDSELLYFASKNISGIDVTPSELISPLTDWSVS